MNSSNVNTTQHILFSTDGISQVSARNIGKQYQLAVWQNSGVEVAYEKIKGHTFSYYLKGGDSSINLKSPNEQGGPGKYCFIPDESYSTWKHQEELEFFHLNISDSEIKRFFVTVFDQDSRLFSLPEITFQKLPQIQNAFINLILSFYHGNELETEIAISEALYEFVSTAGNSRSLIKMTGGLSGNNMKKSREYIEANLCSSLTLQKLASEVNLSEFHFQRMFRTSFGISPASWIIGRRVERAKKLMQTDAPLALIASECGFSDQSHLTRIFKIFTGITPKVYKDLL